MALVTATGAAYVARLALNALSLATNPRVLCHRREDEVTLQALTPGVETCRDLSPFRGEECIEAQDVALERIELRRDRLAAAKILRKFWALQVGDAPTLDDVDLSDHGAILSLDRAHLFEERTALLAHAAPLSLPRLEEILTLSERGILTHGHSLPCRDRPRSRGRRGSPYVSEYVAWSFGLVLVRTRRE